jgi:hypothetical protein
MRWERMKRDTRSRVSTGQILYMLGSRWMAEICLMERNGRMPLQKRVFSSFHDPFSFFLTFSFFFFFFILLYQC